MDPEIFITYSSKDQKVARTICTALENRGLACWISSRNVKPGQNYQEQIVKAIRAAKIMVLVFTSNANNSDEIKKELALASQNKLVVIPVRIEDVIPNEAFAYEFATRQWIDLFDDWENSIAQLVEPIAAAIDDQQSGHRTIASRGSAGDAAVLPSGKTATVGAAPVTAPASFAQRPKSRWAIILGVAIVVAAAITYEAWTLLRQSSSSSAVTKVSSEALDTKSQSRSCLAQQTFAQRNDFVAWSDGLSLDTIRADIDDKISRMFTCPALIDAQAFDLFAKMSVLVAQAASDPSCFDGDSGVVSLDRAFHLNFAQHHGRADANGNLQWKTGKALGCVNKERQGLLFADLAMALVDADRGHRDRSLATPSQYLGCFKDQQINPTGLATTQGRDLNGFITNDPNMTSARCLAICSSQGFSYAATQYGTYCFCGTSFGRSGLANNCDMACGGNPTEMCGGVFANSVYSVTGAKAQ